MSDTEGMGLLAALELKGVGPARVRARLQARADVPQDPDGLLAWLGRPASDAWSPADVASAWTAAERRLVESEERGIRLLIPTSQAYPAALRMSPDAPVTLWCKGNAEALSTPSIAVVGTRNPSAAGATVARRTGRLLAKEGITVVSGLALGCDSEAHVGATSHGGVAVAVLAHGLDDVRPASSRPLAKKVLETGGALVSEYAVGIPARPQHFVQRNRIQVGLAEAIVVVETGRKGGTMHTVRFANEAGRLVGVWAAPAADSDVWSDDSRAGNRALLEEKGTFRVETPDQLTEVARLARQAFEARLRQPQEVPRKWSF